MSVYCYIFHTRGKEHLVPEIEQQTVLREYAGGLGYQVEEFIIEDAVSLKKPFNDRPAGGKLLRKCGAGDVIVVMKTEYVLSSAGDGLHLLRSLKEMQVALHCIDLGGNISLPEKRRLMVSEGPALVVEKLLAALSADESSRHGQAIQTAKRHKKEQGKYLGGPVPFGLEVNREGYLIPNLGQQQVITAILSMRADRWSYREISQKLKDEYEVHLSHEGVRKILKSQGRKEVAGNT